MAGLASFRRALAVSRMSRRDVFVAIGTGCARRWPCFVWLVAAQAILGAMHRHGWRLSLRRGVAAFAVAGTKCAHERRLATPVRAALASGAEQARSVVEAARYGVVATPIEREGVARRAIRPGRVSELVRSLGRCVLDTRLLLMASRAASGVHVAYLAFADFVAARARDALPQYVRTVAAHRACHVPRLLDVDPLLRVARIGTSSRDGSEHERQKPHGERSRRRAHGG